MRAFTAPGPVAEAFMRSGAFLCGIVGPVGSGKTSAAMNKVIWAALRQKPDADGVIRVKALVIRDTFPNLETTTLPSWHNWFPETMGRFVGNVPITHRLRFELTGGYVLDLWVEFRAIGDKSAEAALAGWEGTFAYINEADFVSEDVLSYLITRVGRYPPGGATWRGIFCDNNGPHMTGWFYRLFYQRKLPEGFEDKGFRVELFEQPGGTDPGAENLGNLPAHYYDQMLATLTDERAVRSKVHGKPVAAADGKPVYPQFNHALHVRDDLVPDPALPVIIGFDAGLTPTAVFCQQTSTGQWRVIDELEGDGDAVGFAEALTRRLSTPMWRDIRLSNCLGYADPAASASNAAATEGASWRQVMLRHLRMNIRPAPTNDPGLRWSAVRAPLQRLLNGEPGFVIDRRCASLIRGFLGDYRFKKRSTTGVFSEQADKNEFSHVHDGLQYALSGGGEHDMVMNRRRRPGGHGGYQQPPLPSPLAVGDGR